MASFGHCTFSLRHRFPTHACRLWSCQRAAAHTIGARHSSTPNYLTPDRSKHVGQQRTVLVRMQTSVFRRRPDVHRDEGACPRFHAVAANRRKALPDGRASGSHAHRLTIVTAIADPRHFEWIDQIKGSLPRIQVCHEALLQAGEDLSPEDLQTGIGHFFREHRFLDAARNRPIPHEAYYLNSGCFCLFGHYYASMIIARLPQADRDKYWPKLQYEVIKTQQKDGSMWDFEMHNYSKPYGVAFGLLTLKASIEHLSTKPTKPAAVPAAATTTSK